MPFMQYVVFIVVGAIALTAISQSFAGFVTGGLLGWIAATLVRLQRRVAQQGQRIDALVKQLAEGVGTATAEPIKPEAHATGPARPKSPADATDNGQAVAPGSVAPTTSEPTAPESDTLFELDPEPAVAEPHASLAADSEEPAEQAQAQAWRTGGPGGGSNWLAPLLARAQQWVVGYFTGGNLMVRVGIVILFFGIGFLLKYAAEKVVVPVELRYVGILAAALVMLVLGWRLRRNNAGYALALQGGALGVLYLVIFFALQLHQLLSPSMAFGLLLVVAAMTATLAVLQNAVWLAAVGVTGGFLAPVLASSGSGAYIGLFSYYLVLNVLIAFIAFYRSWRLLNWLGFVFTFGIGTLWGAQSYQAAFFNTTEPFLVSFFLLYVLIALLFAMKQPPQLKGLVDGTLVFGTPVAFMGLQSQLLEGFSAIPHLMAWTSALVGLLYLGLAGFVRKRAGLALLGEAYVALAVAFLTLAIPLGFDGRVTSAVWAAEGAALIWVGLRQAHLLPRLSGLALIFVAGYFYWDEPAAEWPTTFLINADFIGALLLAAAALYASRLYRALSAAPASASASPRPTFSAYFSVLERRFGATLLLVWGYVWWLGGGLREIQHHFSGVAELALAELLVVITGVACWLLAARTRSLPPFVLGLLTAVLGLAVLVLQHHFSLYQTIWLNLNAGSAALLVALYLWMAVFAWRQRLFEATTWAPLIQRGLLWAAVVVALGFGVGEIGHYVAPDYQVTSYLLYALVVLLPLIGLHHRLCWPSLTQPVLVLLPVLALTLFSCVARDEALSAFYGWLVFPLAMIGWYGALKYLERVPSYPLGYLHLATALLLVAAFGWEVSHWLQPQGRAPLSLWAMSAWGFTLALACVVVRQVRQLAWPMRCHAYEMTTLLPRTLLGVLAAWVVVSNLQAPGAVGAVPYVPLLNVLDMVNLAALGLVFLGLHRHDVGFIPNLQLRYILPGALAFLWANAALLRAFHFSLGVPFQIEPMARSFAVQSGVSILWSAMGLVTMLLATRLSWRTLWLVGGALMAVVVLKLFTVDMAGTGTIARIIAFLTVGALLLVVGYFAPVPPKVASDKGEPSAG
ncbi:DUF2339 domain-containing protein [Marinobacter caseinilyticus]|uniref:DUF2339 domain-containing protein n=1 Tax=Marinobacter caseinilyticus TaxID=2692195 RepID=UPI00140BCDDA|nr:DUF2339 domain-containing protein [Marinobacter caseinilyticus]